MYGRTVFTNDSIRHGTKLLSSRSDNSGCCFSEGFKGIIFEQFVTTLSGGVPLRVPSQLSFCYGCVQTVASPFGVLSFSRSRCFRFRPVSHFWDSKSIREDFTWTSKSIHIVSCQFVTLSKDRDRIFLPVSLYFYKVRTITSPYRRVLLRLVSAAANTFTVQIKLFPYLFSSCYFFWRSN